MHLKELHESHFHQYQFPDHVRLNLDLNNLEHKCILNLPLTQKKSPKNLSRNLKRLQKITIFPFAFLTEPFADL